MRILTLRDNSSYRALGEPITATIAAVATTANLLASLFGGGNAGGYDETGRFIPGDIDNRLQFLAQWMSRYGLNTSDIDKSLVDTFIYQEGGWQGQVSSYVQQVAEDKKNNPEKYVNKQIFNGGNAGLNMNGGLNLGGMNVTTILLIGAAVYLGAQLLGKGKRRR